MNPAPCAQAVSLPANLYQGRCLCGTVRFQVELDARSDGALWGLSVWECIIAPANFELLSGSEHVSGHQFAVASAHHFFCERCGTRSFSHHPEGTCGEFYTVDLRSLDSVRRGTAPTSPAMHPAPREHGPVGQRPGTKARQRIDA